MLETDIKILLLPVYNSFFGIENHEANIQSRCMLFEFLDFAHSKSHTVATRNVLFHSAGIKVVRYYASIDSEWEQAVGFH